MTTATKLPGALADIAEIAGERAAQAIAVQRGGTEIYVPPHVGPDHWLVQLVGQEAADAICAHYRTVNADGVEVGMRHLAIPFAETHLLERARERCRQELLHGATARQAALRSGLSERSVYRAKARLRGARDPDQPDLFGGAWD